MMGQFGKVFEKLIYMDSKIKCGVGTGGKYSHCCSIKLQPICISELEYAVFHNEGESFNGCILFMDGSMFASLLLYVLLYYC